MASHSLIKPRKPARSAAPVGQAHSQAPGGARLRICQLRAGGRGGSDGPARRAPPLAVLSWPRLEGPARQENVVLVLRGVRADEH